MKKSWHLPAGVMNLLLIVGLASIWFAFAPLKLGGQVSYVLVNGNSMEPRFHKGDLVLVRTADSYQVGDVVTYHDAQINANVIHRIIDTQKDRFIMKGDNNSWIDAYQPTPAEVLGRLWVYLPNLGADVLWIRNPLNMALSVSLIGGLLMVNGAQPKANRKRKRSNKPTGIPVGNAEMLLYGSGILALVFLGLAVFAFTHPLMRAADVIKYDQKGVFSYSAGEVPGVYDQGAVKPGDPIFTRLTCVLNLAFDYNLESDRLEDLSGSLQLEATLFDSQSGWKRTIPLVSASKFSSSAAASTASLNLCEVEDLVTSVENKTGINLSTATLTVSAYVSISGKMLGQAFKDTFEPVLTFSFDKLHFYIAGSASQTSPLKTTLAGSFPNSNQVDNTIQLFGLKPSVRGLRTVGVIGFFLSVGSLLGLVYYFYRETKDNEEVAIRMKYGPLLIDVFDRGLKNLSPVIDVASIEDLAKLAERQNVMMMHLVRSSVHYYVVQIEGTTYRYSQSNSRPKGAGQDRPARKPSDQKPVPPPVE
jgi:signal peptidase I